MKGVLMVYVSPTYEWKFTLFGRSFWFCRLTADTIGELFDMMVKLGIEDYEHDGASYCRINEQQRKKAVDLGALDLEPLAYEAAGGLFKGTGIHTTTKTVNTP